MPLYYTCAEGRHDECQEYSAIDRCSCACHTTGQTISDDDPDADEANW